MKMDITGRNIDITPAIRDFTKEKISRLDRWIDDVMEVHVVLSVEKHRHSAELVVKGRHHTFTGIDETGDMYASIGNAVDKIDKQARRQKDKDATRRRRAVGTTEAVGEVLGGRNGGSPEAESDEGETPGDPRIIRSVPQSLKPMSIEDAALHFKDSDREFLVFREARSLRFRVMYRRKDRNLGLIEPED